MTLFNKIKEEIVPKDPQVAFPESMKKMHALLLGIYWSEFLY